MSQFLDLGYAALIEEYVRMGSSLTESLEKTREYSAGFKPPNHVTPAVTAGGNRTTMAAVRREPPAENVAPPPTAETFLVLENAMKGLGGFSR